MEIFYQVFDKGMLQDDKGNEVDFKNTIILLTSNVGTDTIMKLCADPDTTPDAGGPGRGAAARPAQGVQAGAAGPHDHRAVFPAGRRGDEADHQAAARPDRASGCRRTTRPQFTYDDDLVDSIAGRCKEVESGARNVDHILTGTLLPEMSQEFLTRMAEGEAISQGPRVGRRQGGVPVCD